MRLELISINLIRLRLQSVIRLINSYITRKGIYITRSPFILLVPQFQILKYTRFQSLVLQLNQAYYTIKPISSLLKCFREGSSSLISNAKKKLWSSCPEDAFGTYLIWLWNFQQFVLIGMGWIIACIAHHFTVRGRRLGVQLRRRTVLKSDHFSLVKFVCRYQFLCPGI